MKKTIGEKINAILIILNGIICLIFHNHILNLLPTLCALVIILEGLVQFVEGIKNKDYASLEKINLEKSIVFMAIGIGILFRQNNALFIIGIFWGLSGLSKATHSLNVTLYNIFHKEKFLLTAVKSILEFSLSLLLIFDPYHSVGHHVIILGLELLLEGCSELFSI